MDTQPALDLSALNQPVSKEELQAEWQYFKNQPGMKFLSILLVFIGVMVGLGLLAALSQSPSAGLITLGILIVIGLLIRWSMNSSFKNKAQLRKFAVANKFTFLDTNYPIATDGAIFSVGSDRKYTGGFETADGSILFANYQYTVGSGKNRRNIAWGVMRAKLSRTLPNVVLDAKSNNVFGRMTNLPSSFSGGQKFELEGDFNKHFSVFAPSGYQRDALYFLTPELMAALVDYGAAYDFEVIDNYLYIYKSGAFKFNAELLPQIFQTIKYFGWQFEDNVNKYNDDRVANAKVANVVTVQGARLKKKFSWLAVVAIVIWILFQVLQAMSSFSN